MHESDTDASFQLSDEIIQAAISPPDVQGRINLRLEKALQNEIEDIAEDSRYPFKSVSEVVRFCCHLGMQELRDWKPAPTLLGAIRAASALAVRDKIQCESIDLIQRLEERIRWYIDHKEYDEAITLVGQIRSYFEGLREEFWRNYMIKQIDAKFEQWLQEIDIARNKEC